MAKARLFLTGHRKTNHSGFGKQIVSPPLLVYHQSQSLTIQFLFNSGDSYSNKYLGWLIDDVEVRIAPLRIETEFLEPATVGQTYSVTLVARVECLNGMAPNTTSKLG
jgi:hypothetical protein